jgi:hypothetical protein
MIGKEFGSRSEAAVKPLIQKRIGTPEATDLPKAQLSCCSTVDSCKWLKILIKEYGTFVCIQATLEKWAHS